MPYKFSVLRGPSKTDLLRALGAGHHELKFELKDNEGWYGTFTCTYLEKMECLDSSNRRHWSVSGTGLQEREKFDRHTGFVAEIFTGKRKKDQEFIGTFDWYPGEED